MDDIIAIQKRNVERFSRLKWGFLEVKDPDRHLDPINKMTVTPLPANYEELMETPPAV